MKGSRRQFLATTASISAASLAGFAGSAAGSEDYDVVQASGQVIQVGNGDTYENKLIDLTTGEDFLIHIHGSNSVVRNIGFKGLYRGGDFMISISAGGGDVLVENVYLGDGATKAGSDFVHGPGAVFYHKKASCDVTFRHMNVQGYTNNGFYCSNTPDGGNVHFKNCFGKNNGVSTFRCGDSGDVIENCVAYNDNTNYGGSYNTGWTEANGRPVWVWNGGEVSIKNSHFAAGTYPYAIVAGANGSPGRAHIEGGAVKGGIQESNGSSVTRSGVGNSPDLSAPDGVPMTPEEAASGAGSGGGDSPSPGNDPWNDEYDVEHIYEIENTSNKPVDYFLQVQSGEFTALDYNGATIDSEKMWAEGDKAAGRVDPGDTHCWGFNDLLVDVSVSHETRADTRVNEEQSHLDRYPRDGADGDEWKDITELLGLDPLDGNDDTGDDGEFETITVPAGQTHEVVLDADQTYENKLIDITADRAQFKISTSGNNATIRNIGVKGQWDGSFTETPILAWAEDEGGEVLVENIYFADGAASTKHPNGPSGVFVPAPHAGTVTVRNVNVQGVPYGAVNASAPGRDVEETTSGAGGNVIIEDSYAANMEPAAFNVGTDGSRVENCVAVEANRGGWAEYNNPTFVDCDFSNNQVDVVGGGDPYDVDNGTAVLDNVRGETTSGDIDGELAGPAQRTKPDEVAGVPLSPKQAASGGGADGDDGTSASHDLGVTVEAPDDVDATLAGTEVTVNGETERTAETDESGQVKFKGLPAGEYDVSAVYEGDLGGSNTPLSTTADSELDSEKLTGHRTITLDEDKHVTLSLTGGDDGQDDGDQDGNDDGSDDNDNKDDSGGDDDSGGGDNPDFNNDDLEELLDSLFGDGGLFDSLFGSGGLFDSLFGR